MSNELEDTVKKYIFMCEALIFTSNMHTKNIARIKSQDNFLVTDEEKEQQIADLWKAQLTYFDNTSKHIYGLEQKIERLKPGHLETINIFKR
jgi:hypothetical protein